jgi:hypothetical protein
LLRVDAAAVTAEAHLDGKWLLRCSDPQLSAEDIALGYKQLIAVERGWRDLKTHLDLRPVYHRAERRIRAHVLLCWLALLLVRLAETHEPTRTWRRIREQLQTLHLGQFTGKRRHRPPAHRTHRRSARHPQPPPAARTTPVPAPRRPNRLTITPARFVGTTRTRSCSRMRCSHPGSCLPRSLICGTQARARVRRVRARRDMPATAS